MPGLTLVAATNTAESIAEPLIDLARSLIADLAEGASLKLGRGEAVAVLADLSHAVTDLASGSRTRAVVRLGVESDPWELGLERSGPDVLVTLFQGGAIPELAMFERRMRGEELVARVRATLAEVAATDARLDCARTELMSAATFADEPRAEEPELVAIEPTGDVPIVIAADAILRRSSTASALPSTVLRADLLPLLFRGRLRFAVGDQVRELADVLVFFVAEQLTAMALEAADAWSRSRPYYRRLVVGGAICGIRLGSQGAASLTLGIPKKPDEARAQTWTFPAVDVAALAQAVAAFGRALTRSLIRRDRTQASNLRLQTFRTRVRELAERVREATRNDTKINEAPESYRAFAESVRNASPSSDAFGRAHLRFSLRWTAAVPGIDLRSTFLCGDRVVVGAAREIGCIDGSSGVMLWKRPAARAASVMTPRGLARLEADGALTLHSLDSGEPVWSTRLLPRAGANASGAVVSAPGLPRLLIVSEGKRHLAAVDLHAGDVRWRFAARRGGERFRLRRAGKLLIVASGEPCLSALDVLTGEVVWRFCDRLRFASQVAADHDALVALAGDGAFVERGGTRLHQLDPWSGRARWSVDLPPHLMPVGAPLLAAETVVVATHGRRGTSLLGFDRRTGELLFEELVCASAASCLLVDDTVILNGEGGEVVAVDATNGKCRYRHVFPCGAEGDRPRRLEPVLRSGALFVPQTEVQVIRPSDGRLLGRVPNEIIPDVLRVDENCSVYLAEESGHVAAYANGPRLSLVSS